MFLLQRFEQGVVRKGQGVSALKTLAEGWPRVSGWHSAHGMLSYPGARSPDSFPTSFHGELMWEEESLLLLLHFLFSSLGSILCNHEELHLCVHKNIK